MARLGRNELDTVNDEIFARNGTADRENLCGPLQQESTYTTVENYWPTAADKPNASARYRPFDGTNRPGKIVINGPENT